jgi:hypothetical protein
MSFRMNRTLGVLAGLTMSFSACDYRDGDPFAQIRVLASGPAVARVGIVDENRETMADYPTIDQRLLDKTISNNRAAQRRIIDMAASPTMSGLSPVETDSGFQYEPSPVLVNKLNGIGLNRNAAYALASLRVEGYDGAQNGQSAAEWWRLAEPKIIERVNNNKLRHSVEVGIGGLALLGMGAALATGNIDGRASPRSGPTRSGPAP